MKPKPGLNLTLREIHEAFDDPQWSAKFPPVLSIDQTAELLQVPKGTIYAWSSQRRLKGCSRRMGKHLRFFRDRLLAQRFN